MKQPIKRTLTAFVAAILIASPVAVSAHPGHDHTTSDEPTSSTDRSDRTVRAQDTVRDRLGQQQQNRLSAMEDKSEKLRERLDSAKKKICERHQTTINRVMDNMNNRRHNVLERITKISDAVQSFYVNKSLDVENYSELVAKIDAAKKSATAATEAQRGLPPLDCNGDHPRADLAGFKQKRAAAVNAMKEYRDTVKDLIKAVKAAAQEEVRS